MGWIILVVLAGYIFSVEFFSYKILPVLYSTRIAALELMDISVAKEDNGIVNKIKKATKNKKSFLVNFI